MKIKEKQNLTTNNFLIKGCPAKRELKYNMIDKKTNIPENSNTNISKNKVVYKREYKYKLSNIEKQSSENIAKNYKKLSPNNYAQTKNKPDNKNVLKNRKENKIDITFNFNLTNFSCNNNNKNPNNTQINSNKKLIENYFEKPTHSRKLSEYYTKLKPMNSSNILNTKINDKINNTVKDTNNSNNVINKRNLNENKKNAIIYCSHKNLYSFETNNKSKISLSNFSIKKIDGNKSPSCQMLSDSKMSEEKNKNNKQNIRKYYLNKNNTEKSLVELNKSKKSNHELDDSNQKKLKHYPSNSFFQNKFKYNNSPNNEEKKKLNEFSRMEKKKKYFSTRIIKNNELYCNSKNINKSSFNDSKNMGMIKENSNILMENPEINFFNIVKMIQCSKEFVD